MITLFRKFFQSKAGIAITLAFLALIAFAFASSDLASTATFGGVAGGDRVASVGDRRISTSDYNDALTSRLDQIRQQDPTITMDQLIAQGGGEAVLEQMLQVWSIAEYGEQMGLRASKRLIDSEIRAIPGFRGVDGEFDANSFRQRLQQLGRSEAQLREEIALNLMARQLIVPATQGARLPQSITLAYARLLGETRSGAIAAIPASAFLPTGAPSDSALKAYYDETRTLYTRPERRVLRYGVFGEDALGDIAAPTAQQIARRYERDANLYAATQRRSFTRLVVPTKAAAQAVIDEVAGGVTLEASAQAKGLTTVAVPSATQTALASDTSDAVAKAAFAATRGGLSAPAQGQLGWYVMRVDAVEQVAGKSLEQASAEITAQLLAERRTLALNELTAGIEEELADGRALTEVAEEIGIELQTTAPLTAQGLIYGTPNPAPELLAPVLSVAFQMDESEPQLAETVPGQQFMIFDVSEITESAVAPMAEIREELTQAWRLDQGMKAAGEASKRILDRVAKGSTLAAAIQAEDVALPPPGNLTMNRRQLNEQRQQGQVPPPLMLLFSMAEGTSKRVELAANDRWFVVQLAKIDAPELAADDETLPFLMDSLGETLANEYAEALVDGIEKALKVETNKAGVDAVIAQLTGRSN